MYPVKRSLAVALLAAGAAALVPAGVAAADPVGDTFPIACDNGITYTAVGSPGHGAFTPAFDTASNTVLVPVVFGEVTGTLSKDGSIIDTFTSEGGVKGSGKQRDLVNCTYTFSDTFTLTEEEATAADLPGAGTYTFAGGGPVAVQIRGH
jgi:hypothetical protein